MPQPQMPRPQEPSGTARKGKRSPNKTSWAKGRSGNPAGRKRTGESWGHVWRTVTEKTPEELSSEVGGQTTELGRALAVLPNGVPMKRLVAMRVLLALMSEPSAGLLNALINTEELVDFEDRLTALESRPTPKRHHRISTRTKYV